MIMDFYREQAIKLNLIGLIIGAVLTLLSTIGVFFPNEDFVKNSDPLKGFFEYIGNYVYWLFIIALGLLITCGWLFGDLILKLNKFKELIDTNSKSNFVRHQNELEDLAWKLGSKYWDMLVEKKKEFKIRK